MIDDTKKENEENVTDAGESSEAVAGGAASLTINDLANIKQIMDVASTRGAFKANEFQVVGVTYDRLVTFLKSVMPEKVTEPDAEDADAEETPDADGTVEA